MDATQTSSYGTPQCTPPCSPPASGSGRWHPVRCTWLPGPPAVHAKPAGSPPGHSPPVQQPRAGVRYDLLRSLCTSSTRGMRQGARAPKHAANPHLQPDLFRLLEPGLGLLQLPHQLPDAPLHLLHLQQGCATLSAADGWPCGSQTYRSVNKWPSPDPMLEPHSPLDWLSAVPPSAGPLLPRPPWCAEVGGGHRV